MEWESQQQEEICGSSHRIKAQNNILLYTVAKVSGGLEVHIVDADKSGAGRVASEMKFLLSDGGARVPLTHLCPYVIQ